MQFALNMRYLSPRAYEYLRHKFCDNLPHSDTIRKWFSINKTGYMDEMDVYIDGLSLHGRPITQSQRSTGFVGMKSNFIALKMMYHELVETGLNQPG